MYNNVCADFSSGGAVIEDAMPKGLQSLQRTIDTDVKMKEGAQFNFLLHLAKCNMTFLYMCT